MSEARLEKTQSEETPTTAEPQSAEPQLDDASGLVSLASHWVATAGARVKAMVELALAEARLAAISVALMAFLGMLAAAFVLGAWALMIAGLIYGLIQLGLPVWPILVGLCVVHVLIAVLAWRGAVYLSNNLEFPTTRKHFSDNQEIADEVAEATKES